jgi:hypothetical protein
MTNRLLVAPKLLYHFLRNDLVLMELWVDLVLLVNLINILLIRDIELPLDEVLGLFLSV